MSWETTVCEWTSFPKDSTPQIFPEFLEPRKLFQHLRFFLLIALTNSWPHLLASAYVSVLGYRLDCCLAFLDSFSWLLRASVHNRLLCPYTLTFSADFPRQSVMSAAKNAVNLSPLGFSLHFSVSRSKFIESLSIRLEKWSQSASLKLKPPPSVLNSRWGSIQLSLTGPITSKLQSCK